MSDTFQLKPNAGRRREQHRCACGARFVVRNRGGPRLTAVAVGGTWPAGGKSHTLSVPKGTEKDLLVELAPGPEPETGGSG